MKKNQSLLITCAITLFLCGGSVFAQEQEQEESGWWDGNIWSNPDRGFNWYPPDRPVEEQKPKKEEKKDITKMQSVEEIRKEVVRLRDVAIINPSEENIYAYLSANKFVMDKSAVFTDVWRRVVWKNPDIDYNVKSPQANFAQIAIKDSKNMQKDALMEKLAKTHGIVFFFRSDCDYCHLQAPIVKMLNNSYGIEVLPVSLDGRGIKDFTSPKPDNGISMLLSRGRGIDIVPSMFLISRDQKEIVPLGSGILAMDEMVERIRVLYTTQPGDDF